MPCPFWWRFGHRRTPGFALFFDVSYVGHAALLGTQALAAVNLRLNYGLAIVIFVEDILINGLEGKNSSACKGLESFDLPGASA